SDGSTRARLSVLLLFSRRTATHVHVQHAEGEAKFWIDPIVELHGNYGLKPKTLSEALDPDWRSGIVCGIQRIPVVSRRIDRRNCSSRVAE
ncbi:MAG TPA: DUF4160 domain-containing protein, partial [Vicinamibacterales bacterium]|nr:DUF4160 domain-containing protein [Vicinamibacterales bacterium]